MRMKKIKERLLGAIIGFEIVNKKREKKKERKKSKGPSYQNRRNRGPH